MNHKVQITFEDRTKSERQYMSIKEFLKNYPMKEPMNYNKTIGRVEGAYWFEFYDAKLHRETFEKKLKSYKRWDVVFFGITNFKFIGVEKIEHLFGSVKIELMDEKTGFIKLHYKNEHYEGVLSFNAEKVGVRPIEAKFLYTDIPQKCMICGKEALVDEYGSGECKHCGWIQGKFDKKLINEIVYPNSLSFANAKKLFKEGKPLKPTFEEFLEGLDKYLHYSFSYNSKEYGALSGHGNGFEIFENNVAEGYQSYETIEEFKAKANINGKLLKDIWHEVENAFVY